MLTGLFNLSLFLRCGRFDKFSAGRARPGTFHDSLVALGPDLNVVTSPLSLRAQGIYHQYDGRAGCGGAYLGNTEDAYPG